MYYWTVQSYYGVYLSANTNWLNLFVDLVIAAKKPVLSTVLHLLEVLISKIPQTFEIAQINRIISALNYLTIDTELPEVADMIFLKDDYSRIPVDDRPDYRSASAKLAYQLYGWYEQMQPNEPKPEILLRWQTVCQADILPEVRRAWDTRVVG
jgi:hypothetical protein